MVVIFHIMLYFDHYCHPLDGNLTWKQYMIWLAKHRAWLIWAWLKHLVTMNVFSNCCTEWRYWPSHIKFYSCMTTGETVSCCTVATSWFCSIWKIAKINISSRQLPGRPVWTRPCSIRRDIFGFRLLLAAALCFHNSAGCGGPWPSVTSLAGCICPRVRCLRLVGGSRGLKGLAGPGIGMVKTMWLASPIQKVSC